MHKKIISNVFIIFGLLISAKIFAKSVTQEDLAKAFECYQTQAKLSGTTNSASEYSTVNPKSLQVLGSTLNGVVLKIKSGKQYTFTKSIFEISGIPKTNPSELEQAKNFTLANNILKNLKVDSQKKFKSDDISLNLSDSDTETKFDVVLQNLAEQLALNQKPSKEIAKSCPAEVLKRSQKIQKLAKNKDTKRTPSSLELSFANN